MLTAALTLVPYTRRFRRDVLHLLDENYRLHIHLDWQTVDTWLDESDRLMWLAWHNQTLVGALAVAAPIGGATWIRLAAVHDSFDPHQVLADLWPPVREQLRTLDTHEIGALLQRPWLADYVDVFDLQYRELIVTLQRTGGDWPPSRRTDLVIRYADARDLPLALAIDHAAFAPIWRMSRDALREAIRQSASFKLAYDITHSNTDPVGYQLSTMYHTGGHLARLAILPNWQGQGIGGALLDELLTNFSRRRVLNVSVNTQESNVSSQRLYQHFGFNFTGPDMPIWIGRLD
jgi:ribosomal protein S18 acetylase RimI-like enzyme